MTEILQSKKKSFYIKASIWKDREKTSCPLPNSQIKVDQKLDQVIINPKLVKKLNLKINSIKKLANHCLGIYIANKDFTELKSWVKF